VSLLPCLENNTLHELVSGALDDSRRQEVVEHIATCHACRRLVAAAARALPSDAAMRTTLASPLDGAPVEVDALWLPRGTAVGRFLVLERIGQGGMGVVYAAYDPQLERKVALKMLRADETEPGTMAKERRERLMREAKALARLAHPNVVAVHDIGTFGAQLFVAMELVDGQTLRQWATATEPGWRALLAAYRQAGQALAAAHALGIVHRDFKPDNALIETSGRVRVVDFGLACAGEPAQAETASPPGDEVEGALTQTGSLLGTPAYMAPEQLVGGKAGTGADQFGFCVALYEALWRERPFVGGTLVELHAAITIGRMREPADKARAPAWILRALERGLHPEPSERYPSMNELLAALNRDVARTRRRWLSAAVALALLMIVGVGLVRARHGAGVCRGGPERLASIWNDERRDAMHAAFAATGKPFAEAMFTLATRELDDHAHNWTALYTESCEATRLRGEQSEEVMQLKMECLDQHREELRALLDVLVHADADVVLQAGQAVQELQSLDECRNSEALRQIVRPPANAEIRQKATALRARLAEVDARTTAGRYAEAYKLSEMLVADAKKLGYAPIVAEALSSLGVIEDWLGDYKSAVDTLLSAVSAAEIARHDHAKAKALIHLVFTLGTRYSRYEEAHSDADMARAALTRAGGDTALEFELDAELGKLLGHEARYQEALTQQKQLLARTEQLEGKDGRRVGLVLGALGQIYQNQGDREHALECYQRALTIYEKVYGPVHPNVATIWNNLSGVLSPVTGASKQQIEAAIHADERALAIYEAALGPEHSDAIGALQNLALDLNDAGQHERAIKLLERALTISMKSLGTEHPLVASAELNLGRLLAERRRFGEAFSHLQHGLAIRERTLDSNHPLVGEAVLYLGVARLWQGEPAQALPIFERALAIIQRNPQSQYLGYAQFQLARALADSGRDRVRARTLALQARETYTPRTEVDAWLARH
jgi:tetratricopeptide (TPR) repeat protein